MNTVNKTVLSAKEINKNKVSKWENFNLKKKKKEKYDLTVLTLLLNFD